MPSKVPCLLRLPLQVSFPSKCDATDAESLEQRAEACRFLLSIYVLDAASMAVGRTMAYEVRLTVVSH